MVTGEHDAQGLPVLSEPVNALITRWGYQGAECYRPHDVYVTPAGLVREVIGAPGSAYDGADLLGDEGDGYALELLGVA